MLCGFSQNKSNPFRIWNPKTHRAAERRNAVFIEAPPHLLPPSRRTSPLQGLEAPSFYFSDNSLDNNYNSRGDMIRDVEDYNPSALDFDVNNATYLLLPLQSLPGSFSSGGATLQGSPSPPVPAPVPASQLGSAPAASQSTATGTNRYVMQPGVTRAVTRSQVPSPAPTPLRQITSR